MGEWSQKAKDNIRIRKEMRIEEACDATIEVLEDLKYLPGKGRRIKKKFLMPIISKRIHETRKEMRKNGDIYSHAGVEIRKPDAKFIESNWGKITKLANDSNVYIVWTPSKGVSLGTQEEYRKNTSMLKGCGEGIVESINDRTDVVNERGCNDTYIDIVSKQLPERTIIDGSEYAI